MTRLVARGTTLIAQGEVTEATADALAQLLLYFTDAPETAWTLDLSGVEAIDRTGTETLARFLGESPHVKLRNPSRAVQDFFAQFGVITLLDLD